jgi:hypothetical protein
LKALQEFVGIGGAVGANASEHRIPSDRWCLNAHYLVLRDPIATPLGLTGEDSYPLVQEWAVPVEEHEVDLAIGPWVTTPKIGFAHWSGCDVGPLIGRNVMRQLSVPLD